MMTDQEKKPYKLFADESVPCQWPRSRTFDVEHLTLAVRFDIPKKKVIGRATLRLKPIQEPLQKITLDAVNFHLKKIQLNQQPVIDYDYDEEKLSIPLPKRLSGQKEFLLEIDYEVTPKKGIFFIEPQEKLQKPFQIWSQGEAEDNRHWFPCVDYPNERLTTELLITVDRPYTALSNGRLKEITERGQKTRTFHWIQDFPHPAYLISVVVGDFACETERWKNVDLHYYVPQGDEAKIKTTFGNTKDMLTFFSEKIGYDYPYPKYAQVMLHDFPLGGMENTSITSLTHTVLHDESVHRDLHFSVDSLLSHELAHQWWGDLVTCKSWSHIWLNEAFATYFQCLYEEYHYGKDRFYDALFNYDQAYFEEDAQQYRRPIVCERFQDPQQLFDTHTYQKGAWVLHGLRGLLGNQLFWKAISHYVHKFAGKSVETHDFKNAIEEATGQALDGFFKQWLFQAGYPELKLSWQYLEDKKLVQLSVEQTQFTDDLSPVFQFSTEVACFFELPRSKKEPTRRPDNSELIEKRYPVEIKKKSEQIFIPVSQKPLFIGFDPDSWILKKTTWERSKKEWKDVLLQAPSIPLQREAALALKNYPHDDDVLQALGEALRRNSSYVIRKAIAQTLGAMKSPPALEVLEGALQKEKDVHVRRFLASALGSFYQSDKALGTLEDLVNRDSSVFVVAEALHSLGKIQHSRAPSLLEKGLTRDSYQEIIRQKTLLGMAELHDPQWIPSLLTSTQEDVHAAVRMGAILALGKLYPFASKSQKEEVKQKLIQLMRDPYRRIRAVTIQAIIQTEEMGFRAPLLALKEQEPFQQVRDIVKEALDALSRTAEKPREVESLKKEVETLRSQYSELHQRLLKLEAKKKR